MRPQGDLNVKATGPSFADLTEPVNRSPIRRMFDIAQQHDGDDLAHTEIGEPNFDTPEHIHLCEEDFDRIEAFLDTEEVQ